MLQRSAPGSGVSACALFFFELILLSSWFQILRREGLRGSAEGSGFHLGDVLRSTTNAHAVASAQRARPWRLCMRAVLF